LTTHEFKQQSFELIDNLKNVCAAYGLGNDGNEFKVTLETVEPSPIYTHGFKLRIAGTGD